MLPFMLTTSATSPVFDASVVAPLAPWLRPDMLSLIMMALIVTVVMIISWFSKRYMAGDARYRAFYATLGGLTLALLVMVCANHFVVFAASWLACNALLVRLMVHEPGWQAARASGWLAGRSFILGGVALLCAFGLFYAATGQTTIAGLIQHQSLRPGLSPGIFAGLALLVITALTQSAIWPCHRWLLSSLNSPTPVSALMHAGLVNAGGFLLTRFAPLYFSADTLLQGLVVLGLLTAFIGTSWKLVQTDVKRMFAASTMAQMGFMVTQCGLGLFPAAVAHLCWHGLFKAYLFLASPSTAKVKRMATGYPPSWAAFLLALPCGVVTSYGFALASGKAWLAMDTTLILLLVAFITGSQFALTLLQRSLVTGLLAALPLSLALGGLYGGSVGLFSALLAPYGFSEAQPLTALHLVAIAVLILAWVGLIMVEPRLRRDGSRLGDWLYMAAVNTSLPERATMTLHRNRYVYD